MVTNTNPPAMSKTPEAGKRDEPETIEEKYYALAAKAEKLAEALEFYASRVDDYRTDLGATADKALALYRRHS